MLRITFLGAAGTVTGSKYLVETDDARVLIDVGLFQGNRETKARNWDDPHLGKIDAVLLTHAHIDHTGLLPRYVALGLHAPVYATKATALLADVLLPDSGYLQEEEARWRKRKKRSRHADPKPLYTQADARRSLELFRTVEFHQWKTVAKGVRARWKRMGHILGAASIEVEVGGRKLNFSGDIGRYNIPILKDPEPTDFGDLLLIESTYGDRLHPELSVTDLLTKVINETYARQGVVVIPSFAVGRAQLLLYYLAQLKGQGVIPDLPVYIDSPMACDATDIYQQCPEEFDEELLALSDSQSPFSAPTCITSVKDSKYLNTKGGPMVIISASGMLSGGRILHHLKQRVSDENNTILFVGFQPKGGRGDWMLSGAHSMRLLGEEVPIKAQIEQISGLSAHADYREMIQWCRASQGKPGKVAIVHGEPEAAQAFHGRLTGELGWDCFLPDYLETIDIP